MRTNVTRKSHKYRIEFGAEYFVTKTFALEGIVSFSVTKIKNIVPKPEFWFWDPSLSVIDNDYKQVMISFGASYFIK